jgi:hypothetical protein
MRFAYKRYEIPKSSLDGSTEIHRPEIVVHLFGGAGEIYCPGLVDTGADRVVIGQTIARLRSADPAILAEVAQDIQNGHIQPPPKPHVESRSEK